MSAKTGSGDDHGHTHGPHCQQCGHAMQIERSYKVNDRMLEALLVGLAQSMRIDVRRKGRKGSPLVVRSEDRELLDRYEARLGELIPKLDAELLQLTLGFVKEHTGVELKVTV